MRPDVIIRDVDRVDSYPETDERGKGISPWFRAALLRTYKRGAKIGLRIGTLTECGNGFRYTDYNAGEKGDIKVFLIGEIAYESIVAVNWDGDEFYYFPHIYCHFNHNGEPYERLIYCKEIDMGDGIKHYSEVAEYETVKLNSQRFGVEYFS